MTHRYLAIFDKGRDPRTDIGRLISVETNQVLDQKVYGTYWMSSSRLLLVLTENGMFPEYKYA